jgi:hypothetical protein
VRRGKYGIITDGRVEVDLRVASLDDKLGAENVAKLGTIAVASTDDLEQFE